MRFRKGPKENNGRNSTWFTTVDNGRDIKLVVQKKHVKAQLLARSNGKVYEEQTFAFPATLRVASTFDPNDPTSQKAVALKQALLDWVTPPAPVAPAAPVAAPSPPVTSVKPPAQVTKVAKATSQAQTMQEDLLNKSAWDVIRNGIPKLNFTVIKQENGRAKTIRIHSIEVTMP